MTTGHDLPARAGLGAGRAILDFPLLLRFTQGGPRRRVAAAVAAIGAVSAVGLLDSVTGSALSFAVFYVLVTVAVTLAAGGAVGMITALWSSVLWGVADAVTGRSAAPTAVHVWNAGTRFAVHGIVVLLVTALVRALRAARESEAQSRAFLATAAHQLRTPVTTLSVSVEAMVLEGLSPANERLLANVATEASRLGRLVTALLRTARLDQGETTSARLVDVVELCEQELARVRQLSVLEWALEAAADVPVVVEIDAEATAEALGNLLDNARRHAESRVVVRVATAPQSVTIQVVDDGPGLPSGSEQRAFDRFVTLDGCGGTGLGLSIAQDLARRQGGDLRYASKAFILTLPLTTGARATAATAGAARGRRSASADERARLEAPRSRRH